uniref:Dual specificity phosphatase 10 n=1 Tax=Moschus moschiferus TaxID=68415 RepID=A0A8C6FTB5_MOSMO
MPPSPLDDRVVVALSRPVRPQDLNLCLDSSYLGSAAPGSTSHPPIIATTVVSLKAANLTYMPSSSGSARSLNCGCSSASCCTVATYDKDNQVPTQAIASGTATTAIGSSTTCPASQMVNNSENAGSLSPSGGVGSPVAGTPKQLASIKIIYPNDLAKKMTKCSKSHLPSQGPVIIDCRPFMEYNKSHIQGAVHINCADKISRRRLQQGKITVLDLISCREGKDSFKRIFSKEIIVYDENTNEPSRVVPSQPLHIVLESLKREGKEPLVLKGNAPTPSLSTALGSPWVFCEKYQHPPSAGCKRPELPFFFLSSLPCPLLIILGLGEKPSNLELKARFGL